MKIAISILAIAAAVCASTSRLLVATDNATDIIPETDTTTTPNIHDPTPSASMTDKEVTVENPDGTLSILKDKDKKKNKCKFDECKTCIHNCGEARHFSCIYFQCMPDVCKNCNLSVVHESPHPPIP
ncbi:hypothetical protein F4803DRAFT_557198 [Xylaria telfairii]|nr:hypothetical protein F4803DRAFT_557198 [Xylaria telfairii]